MDDLITTVAIVALVVAVHTVFAVYIYRSLSESRSDPATGESADGGPGGFGASDAPGEYEGADRPDAVGPPLFDGPAEDTVRCPTCGVPNAAEFRFCRRCVSDLSSGGADGIRQDTVEFDG
jgi:hypothetical protein